MDDLNKEKRMKLQELMTIFFELKKLIQRQNKQEKRTLQNKQASK